MKQSINSSTFIAIVAALVLLLGGAAWWVWRAPSVSPAATAPPVSRAEVNAAMKESHGGPSEDERKQIQEWKRTHPGSFTRF